VRLEFNVLWFENQPDEVKPQIRALEEQLVEHGFKLVLNLQESAINLDALADEQERFHDYDLVVVDFDLGDPRLQGDVVAKRVRARFGFTDIIFYSGSKPNDLRQKVKDGGIDGVYCMSRQDLRVGLIEHVEDVVKRISRLESMRGLAVVTAGRGDQHLKDIIRHIHEGLSDADKASLIAGIDKEVGDSSERILKSYSGCEDLDARLGNLACSSMVTLKAAKAFLKSHPDLKEEYEILRKYQDEVIGPRNNLGHVVEVRTATGWQIEVRSGEPINFDSFTTFRKNFLRHLQNLATIVEKLLSGKTQAE
jgi:DNA-binding NarL/FixJ family response regulator